MLEDARGRPLRELRISVTDRCNFRCRYCMPREHFHQQFRFIPRADLLSFEEVLTIARAAVDLGVEKLRLTGGEPLLRRDLPRLVHMLRGIGEVELALTTNGVLLPAYAPALRAAGLSRLTVSLDSLEEATFRRIADADYGPSDVLFGIEAAERAGFGPLKINCVVRRGVNEHEVLTLATRFRHSGHVLRFIEYMDVGMTNGWRRDEVVTAAEILAVLRSKFGLVALEDPESRVARRYRYEDGAGEVGIIASVSEPFCGRCTRARLSAEGKLYTCLFAREGTDLRALLRGSEPARVRHELAKVWRERADRYSELRANRARPARRIEMPYIGG